MNRYLSVLDNIKLIAAQLSLDTPTAVTTSTNKELLQLYAFMKAIGVKMATSYQWPQLKRRYNLTTVAGQATYATPTDYLGLCDGTVYDTTNHLPAIGPATDASFIWQEFGWLQGEIRKYFRVWGLATGSGVHSVTLGTTPSATGTAMIYEYFSSNWIVPSAVWVASTASGILNSYLRFGSQIYQVTTAGTFGATPPTHTSGSASNGSVTLLAIASYDNPIDTDIVLFDQDLIGLGIKYLRREQLGLDYSEQKNEFERMVATRCAKIMGAPKLNMGGSPYFYGISEANIPEGTWSL